jgi:hypothetical protein
LEGLVVEMRGYWRLGLTGRKEGVTTGWGELSVWGYVSLLISVRIVWRGHGTTPTSAFSSIVSLSLVCCINSLALGWLTPTAGAGGRGSLREIITTQRVRRKLVARWVLWISWLRGA